MRKILLTTAGVLALAMTSASAAAPTSTLQPGYLHYVTGDKVGTFTYLDKLDGDAVKAEKTAKAETPAKPKAKVAAKAKPAKHVAAKPKHQKVAAKVTPAPKAKPAKPEPKAK